MQKLTLCLGLVIAFAFSALAHAQPAAPTTAPSRAELIRPIVDREYASLEAFYLAVHQNPEISLHEEKTSARVADELKKAGFEVTTGVGGHGVVGVLKNGPGKTVLVRGDMDALPVQEETGAPYASKATTTDAQGKTTPVMHACGHDVHVTTLVGTARTMAALKDQWSGTLVLIGQPAEEVGQGAAAMLKDGLFTRFPRPDFCLASHVDAELQAGKIGWVSGFSHANATSVDITIRGVGGHGAQPQATKDPVVIAAQVVLGLQTIVSREVHPRDSVVVTVGTIHGGSKNNVIPDEVKLQLTVRTYKDETRTAVLASIDRITRGITAAAGVPKDREPIINVKGDGTPALYNNPELATRMRGVFERTLGMENVVERDRSMGAEDFGRYGRDEPRIPIFMFRVGSVSAEAMKQHEASDDPLPSLHSSKYLPDREPTIRTAVTAMSAAAMDLLAR
jgi:hippurate hydrolase